MTPRRPEEDAPCTSSDTPSASKHSRETTEAGTALVDEFLSTWAARLPGGGEEGTNGAEEELKVLREVALEFKDRIEGNEFTRELLENF